MNEKFLNLILFLIEEFQKDEAAIHEEFLKKGIDLEASKEKALAKTREYKAIFKKEKAKKFKDQFFKLLSNPLKCDEDNNPIDFDMLAVQFRRNSKNSSYELSEEDKRKLIIIKQLKSNNEYEKNKGDFDGSKKYGT